MPEIDRVSPVPPWRQIAAVLREEIEAGVYSPEGPALPSVRRLAQEWDVAPRTANKALKLLAAESLIYPVNGLGYFAKRSQFH